MWVINGLQSRRSSPVPKFVQRDCARKLPRGATTSREWRALCLEALERARKKADHRCAALEGALQLNQEERVLRSLGIVCRQDLDREF